MISKNCEIIKNIENEKKLLIDFINEIIELVIKKKKQSKIKK
ncbi:hypothetical protein N8794_04175 [Candidatus Pelagibacter sp.]|nr:hypothetical protein [Candidatus Pelagibacter sp.]